jgi:prepilin-type processing-associated H-X9-DG protein
MLLSKRGCDAPLRLGSSRPTLNTLFVDGHLRSVWITEVYGRSDDDRFWLRLSKKSDFGGCFVSAISNNKRIAALWASRVPGTAFLRFLGLFG